MQCPRRREDLARGTDCLVGLLSILDLAGVLTRRGVDVLVTVELARLVACGVDGRLRQRRGIGAHVGDVAVLVETLGHAHRALGTETELAPGLLLQCGGHERRVRTAGVGLLLHRCDGQRCALQTRRQRTGRRLVEHQHLGRLSHHANRIEVTTGCHPLAVDCHKSCREPRWTRGWIGDAGIQLGQDVPVRRATEGHPFPLALHNDSRRDGLHAARRQLRRNLLPEHRTDFVAVQPVQDAPGLLGIDQIDIQIAGVVSGRSNRRFGDLVENHSAHRDGGFQRLQQMPGDRFTLAVAVSGEIQLVDTLEQALEFSDGGLLVRADDVQRFEVGIDVDPEPSPLLGLVLGRNVSGTLGQVADMAPGGLDDIVRAQVAGYFARLSGRLDDDEPTDVIFVSASAIVVSQLRLRSNSVVP